MAIYIGHVSAYAIAKANGYEGTEEEFGAMLGQISITLGDLTNLRAVATTRAAGSQATASYADGVLTLGIPRGDKGETGNGIQSVAKTGTSGTNPVVDTYTITYTNGQTTTFQITNGIKGDTGATPELTIGTVTTGEVGSDAAATITGTPEHPVLGLTLPRGATGDVTNLAGTFSSASAYSAGDYVIYNDLLYVFNADHAAGSWTGTDATQVKVGTELSALKEDIKDNYAKNDGYYDGMTVGNAEQIVGTVFEEDDTAYNYRTTGGSVEVGDRAYVDAITGVSLPWNQLFAKHTSTANVEGTSSEGLTITVDNDGYVNISGTPVATCVIAPVPQVSSIPANHVGLMLCDGYDGTFSWGRGGFTISNNFTDHWMNKHTTAFSFIPFMRFVAGTAYNIKVRFAGFDLTAMFGSTIADYIYGLETAHAGDGVAWFKRYFPKPYYAYHAVGMEHVNATAAKTVGFNQWDEEWRNGYYDDGVFTPSSGYVANKNPIRVVPNTTYCLGSPQYGGYVSEYDASGAFIMRQGVAKNATFTVTSNTAFINFQMFGDYGGTYKGDICISIRWDNSRDGDYEPYNLHTYPLADLTLRGVPLIDESGNLKFDGDRYLPDGSVERRYGIIDLGTLTWTKHDNYDNIFFCAIPSKALNGNAITSAYPHGGTFMSYDYLQDKVIYSSIYLGRFAVKDTSYSTAEAFQTSLNGKYAVFELATPTTEEADPYQYPMVVDNWGTEEFVDGLVESGDRDVAIPVGHETKYPPNLKDKLESAANNPDADGAYILTHDGGSNTYTPLASNATVAGLVTRSPELSSSADDGTYIKKAVKSGSTITYQWVKEE